MHTFTHKTYTNAGFSLIELLVSIALFSVVITMSVGTMIVLLDANAKAQNMNVLMTNLSFALNSMSREIRTGFSYHCDYSAVEAAIPTPIETNDCPDGGTRLSVVETDNSLTGGPRGSYDIGSRVTYYYVPSYFSNGNGAILRRVGTRGALPLTSEEINITEFSLLVVGADPGPLDGAHSPRVRLLIAGEAGEIEGLDTSFRLQTTVTQRLLDI
jgi:prepilin-type N-terminal cleavage/methylation domain-containing protein